MQDKFLSAEATVETIRAMRKLGFPPTPEFIGSLVQVISDMHPDMEKEPDGTYQFEIFEVPFIFSFVLSDADFQTSDVGADRRKAVFSLLDHSTDLPTIVDSGRVAVRIASSTEINSTGIDFWNDLVQDVQDGSSFHMIWSLSYALMFWTWMRISATGLASTGPLIFAAAQSPPQDSQTKRSW